MSTERFKGEIRSGRFSDERVSDDGGRRKRGSGESRLCDWPDVEKLGV